MKCIVFVFALFGLAFAEEGEGNTGYDSAHIIASKFSLSQYAVEGMDYVIDYRLYNVGDKVSGQIGF